MSFKCLDHGPHPPKQFNFLSLVWEWNGATCSGIGPYSGDVFPPLVVVGGWSEEFMSLLSNGRTPVGGV